jgi:hypothetical protein
MTLDRLIQDSHFRGDTEDGGIDPHLLKSLSLGLLGKLNNATRVVDLHQSKGSSLLLNAGESCNGDGGSSLAMLADEVAVVHPVEVVTREDEEVLNSITDSLLKEPHVLPHGISSSLEPVLVGGTLGGCKDFDKATAVVPTHRGVVGLGEMAVEGCRVELSEGVDLGDVAIEAVANRDVDQTIVGSQGDSGLCPLLGEGIEASSSASTEDDA